MMAQPITILIAALGGEGGGVLAEWLVETALAAGYPAQSTSIPGVAQRTGATNYYIEVYPEPASKLHGRMPILSLLPVPGCIDLVVASELLEAARTIQAGMVSPERTLLLTSTNRTLTTAEKMTPGDGRFDADTLLALAHAQSRALIALDMSALAREAGTVVSAVMFGAVAASGALPIARAQYEAMITASGVGVEASLRGFARAWDAVRAQRADAAQHPAAFVDQPGEGKAQPMRADRDLAAFPAAIHDMLVPGCDRLREYQDAAYVGLYRQRLARALAAERASDPGHTHGFALTRETARFLALWMAFDDVVRVASLKCRRSRFERVRREVGAGEHDVLRIVDYFKPGIAEFAGMLPGAMARRLMAWDRRRRACGKPTLSLTLHVRTDGVFGFAMMRTLAALRVLRRHGSRYAEEQALIERWLAAIGDAARFDWVLAHEIALCGRLIKGYGDTNLRGKANLEHILTHLAAGAPFTTPLARAAAIRQAREAALADEGGKALDQALVAHGAPPRPAVAQPIRWVRHAQRALQKDTHRAA